MIWKLLKRNISAGQIAGYALANLVGLAIVLSAVKFYGDISAAINGDDPVVSPDYMIISKPVTTLNTLGGGGSTTFDTDEIADLEEQPWVESVGRFTAADFSVSAAVNLQGRGMSTYMFLESIPDEFIDIMPEEWHWDPSSDRLPIIMSKDYLALYNFGFASTQGLPQISESLIGAIPLQIRVAGNGHYDAYPANIVGFSSRLNTIAVPDDFITWANKYYGTGQDIEPSRLIVNVKTPGDPEIAAYFKKCDYEVAGDKVDTGRASYFLSLLTTIVVAIGAIISLLAFFILMLSIYLIMQKSREKLHALMLLGYSPRQVSAVYFRMIAIVNFAVLVLSTGTMFLAQSFWQSRLESLNIASASPLPAIITGIVIVAAITVVNFITISRHVKRNFFA